MTKKQKVFPKEVLINSLLAGALVFFGAFTTGEITWKIILSAIAGAGIACIVRLRNYIAPTNTTKMLFNFVG